METVHCGIVMMLHDPAPSGCRDASLPSERPNLRNFYVNHNPCRLLAHNNVKVRCLETGFIQDALATVREARSAFGAPIYLLGESMGCGVAAAAAARPESDASGLILITPWDSLPDLAQTHYWYLPARILTIDQFNSVRNLRSFDRPVAVAIAKNDTIVPNKHSLRLYHSITAPKRLWEFPGAGHNSWPTDASAPWWQEAMRFVTRNHLPD
jgi:uncharacterized protein